MAEYHGRPIEELEFPDGTVWKVRQPREADFYAYDDVRAKHQAALRSRKRFVTALALSKASDRQHELESAKELLAGWRDEETERLRAEGVPEDEHSERAERAVRKRLLTEADDTGRAIIAEQFEDERLPLELTDRYLAASLVAIFVEPEQQPETLLEKLGPDILSYVLLKIQSAMGGDAAKKRMARES
ncbi:MAG: hypothetical protein JXA87_04735 [Thermoleophilia bacterium]|nr:hypothetical protein [Thermoleophilia bacterium]